MDTGADSEQLAIYNSKRTTVSVRPAAAPLAGTSSVLNNAQGNHIHDNQFITNIKAEASLDILYKRVAPNAILNAGGRADEVRCHPGTREEVIGRIEKWRTNAQDGVPPSRMLWLSGPAGAGKSAIMQTVAESWTSENGIHAANFFFFRTDTSRNHANSLVSTLLYQIFDFYPIVRGAVKEILTSKPRMLDASMKEQFNQLICGPFRSIGLSFLQPFVLLIDGLDECDSEEKTSQRQILRALDALVSQSDLPFLVLVASRVEHQIAMAFNQVSSKVDSIFLDDQYLPRNDIHLFVTAEFGKIKETHHLAHMLDEDWPSAADVYGIVTMSSGQFIYAATAMRFISESSASPKLSLQRVQGTAQTATNSPFSELDALYTHILSLADDQQAVKDILHADFCLTEIFAFHTWLIPYTPETALEVSFSCYDHRYTNSGVFYSCIADLTAMARLEKGRLVFYHASLWDYFADRSRSGEYFIGIHPFTANMLPTLLEHVIQNEEVFKRIYAFLSKPELGTSDIMRALFQVAPKLIDNLGSTSTIGTFNILHSLCSNDDDMMPNYKQILHRHVVRYLSMRDVTLQSALNELHGIPCIQRYLMMAQIELLHGDITQEPDVVVNALRPESVSEAHEIALWVQNLLQRIHREYYPDRLETYKRLIWQWIFWAVSHNIPLSDLHNLPNGRQYLWQSTMKKRVDDGLKYVWRK